MLANALAEDRELDVHLVLSANVEDRFLSGKYTAHRVIPSYPHQVSGFASKSLRQLRYHSSLQTRISRFFKELSPDIVHTQDCNWLTSPLEYRIMRRAGSKLVHTVHNIVMHSMPRHARSLAVGGFRNAYRACDLLLVHDELLATRLRAFLGSALPPITVTPHGVFEVAGRDLSPITRKRLSKKKLLFFGLARPNKGLEFALDALARLDGYSLTIAGDNRQDHYWRFDIEPRIELLKSMGRQILIEKGFVPDAELPALFDRHSCVLLPYTPSFQAQSGILFLALGARIPVVGTDVGALGGTLRQMGIGEVASPQDPESIAGAIKALHDRAPDELNARFTEAQGEWSWSRCAQLTAEAYRALVAR